jgi:Protein of unknown function (DUF2958)
MSATFTLDTEVTSSFQRRPAYRYIRRTDKLPTYDQLGETPASEIVAHVRLFNPTGIGTWWIASYDPDTRIAYGVAELHEWEAGSFGIDELVDFRGLFGLPLERDLHYQPVTLEQVLNGEG